MGWVADAQIYAQQSMVGFYATTFTISTLMPVLARKKRLIWFWRESCKLIEVLFGQRSLNLRPAQAKTRVKRQSNAPIQKFGPWVLGPWNHKFDFWGVNFCLKKSSQAPFTEETDKETTKKQMYRIIHEVLWGTGR